MVIFWLAIASLWSFVFALAPAPGVSSSVALLYDSTTTSIDQFSKFVSSISSFLELDTFDVSVEGMEFSSEKYSTLFVLPCKSKSTTKSITTNSLLDFSINGGNVFVINDSNGTHTEILFYLSQLGIHVSPKDFQYTGYSEQELEFPNTIISKDSLIKPLSNQAVALLTANDHLIPLLRTSESSKSADANNAENVWHLGSEGHFAAGFQSLNNGRTLWFGALSPFIDSSFDDSVVSNLVQWVTKTSGILRSSNFSNSKVVIGNNAVNRIPGYKVGDIMDVNIDLEMWDGEKWVPYNSETPVQMEFVMLDPYYRLNLSQPEDGHYETEFKLPDQHGIFTLQVDYKRPGWSYIKETQVVPVRHLANDEYPRSWEIKNAWVYLNGYIVVTIAWFLFVIALLLCGPPNPNIEPKKNV